MSLSASNHYRVFSTRRGKGSKGQRRSVGQDFDPLSLCPIVLEKPDQSWCQSPDSAFALTPPAGKSSLNAPMNLAISVSVPTDTRSQLFIGGNFRPTRTPRFLNSSATGVTSRPTFTIKKLASEGITS